MGFIFTILGVYTTYRLRGVHGTLAVFALIATLYQASSLIEIFKRNFGPQVFVNMLSSILILGLLLYSFF